MGRLEDSSKLKRLVESAERLCEATARVRKNGKVTSEGTFRAHMSVAKNFCRTIHRAGFLIESVDNLGQKHIDAVFDVWVGKGLKNKTLQNQKSIIKSIFGRMNKPNLAKYVEGIESRYEENLKDGFRVKTVAETSKSHRGAGVDIEKLMTDAIAEDGRFGGMLLIEYYFGLRKKEALLVHPHEAIKNGFLGIRENIAKGGRPRIVPIVDGALGEEQLKAIKYAQSQCEKGESLSWPGKTLKESERRYYYLCEKIGLTKKLSGMTGHGLRAGFAENMMLIDKILPPVLGGTKEMSKREIRQISKARTSQSMGHNRVNVTHAYYGQDQRFAKAGDLIGYEFAEPMKLSSNDKAVLWVSERPSEIVGMLGELELIGASAELAFVTVQIMSGSVEVSRMSVDQFLSMYPIAEDALNVRLGKIGLTLKMDGSND